MLSRQSLARAVSGRMCRVLTLEPMVDHTGFLTS